MPIGMTTIRNGLEMKSSSFGIDHENRNSDSLTIVKRVGAGFSIIVFPIMLLLGFVTHPNILSFAMVTDYNDWAGEWRNSQWFHIGHLLVMFAVPLIIITCVRFMSMLSQAGALYGYIGAILGVFGAFMLAVDKGALTFVLTAFRGLSDADFSASRPAIEAIFNRSGWLWITWAFITLPIGFILQMIGLLKEKIIPIWQGISVILGLALLINPDIEIISSMGALLMCIGLMPIGFRLINGTLGTVDIEPR